MSAKPYRLGFELRELPRMNTSDRVSRWVAVRERDAVIAAVAGELWGKLPKQPLERALVTVTRCSGSREPDYENLTQGAKHVFDALVRLRVLVDDSPRHVDRIYGWTPAPRGKGVVRVTVDEL